MTPEDIKRLEEEVLAEQQDLRQKQMLLKFLKAQQRKVAARDNLSRTYARFVALVTKPFANSYYKAKLRVEDPHRYEAENLIFNARYALSKLGKIQNDGSKKSLAAASYAVKLRAELEAFEDIDDLHDEIVNLRDNLHNEAHRLIPTGGPPDHVTKVVDDFVRHTSEESKERRTGQDRRAQDGHRESEEEEE